MQAISAYEKYWGALSLHIIYVNKINKPNHCIINHHTEIASFKTDIENQAVFESLKLVFRVIEIKSQNALVQ